MVQSQHNNLEHEQKEVSALGAWRHWGQVSRLQGPRWAGHQKRICAIVVEPSTFACAHETHTPVERNRPCVVHTHLQITRVHLAQGGMRVTSGPKLLVAKEG